MRTFLTDHLSVGGNNIKPDSINMGSLNKKTKEREFFTLTKTQEFSLYRHQNFRKPFCLNSITWGEKAVA